LDHSLVAQLGELLADVGLAGVGGGATDNGDGELIGQDHADPSRHAPPRSGRHQLGSRSPDRVVLTVENTGEQLTPQLLSTLIEPFHRGSKRIRTDRAGVAPAIVNSITEAHHGSLTLSLRGGPGGALSLPPAEEAPPLASKRRYRREGDCGSVARVRVAG
jgi:hypothetical protein